MGDFEVIEDEKWCLGQELIEIEHCILNIDVVVGDRGALH